MAAAGVGGVIDVEGELNGLRTTVTELVASVAHLRQIVNTTTEHVSGLMAASESVSGLLAEHDHGVYGETYATDRGPAVRALFFEQNVRATEENARRTILLNDQVAGLEATIAELTGIQTTYNGSVDQLGFDTARIESELREATRRMDDLHSHGGPSPGGRLSVTGMKGFEKLKAYTGDITQWSDWLFKATTWLGIVNRTFEPLLRNLNRCAVEPEEPASGDRMMVGGEALTAEEEWCSDELYHMLVQKCEGNALALVRKQNTQGKARGLIAWYRTLWNAEGQVEEKRTEITERVFYAGRKAVAAKDVAATIATWEDEVREYQAVPDTHLTVPANSEV